MIIPKLKKKRQLYKLSSKLYTACKLQKQLGFELVSLVLRSPSFFRYTEARASTCLPKPPGIENIHYEAFFPSPFLLPTLPFQTISYAGHKLHTTTGKGALILEARV